MPVRILCNNEKIKSTLKGEALRIEQVVYFGTTFDKFLATQDADGMLTLAAWAKTNGLPDCGRQAYQAAMALMAGETVDVHPISLAGLG